MSQFGRACPAPAKKRKGLCGGPIRHADSAAHERADKEGLVVPPGWALFVCLHCGNLSLRNQNLRKKKDR